MIKFSTLIYIHISHHSSKTQCSDGKSGTIQYTFKFTIDSFHTWIQIYIIIKGTSSYDYEFVSKGSIKTCIIHVKTILEVIRTNCIFPNLFYYTIHLLINFVQIINFIHRQ